MADNDPTPEVPEPVATVETPEPAATVEAAAPAEAAPTQRERLHWGTGRVAAIAILVLLLGAGAGFFIGRSTADTGPTSLADAVGQTASGKLPAGDLSLNQILGALGQAKSPLNGNGSANANGGLGGLLGDLLGGNSKNGNAQKLLDDLLGRIRSELNGSSNNSTSSGT